MFLRRHIALSSIGPVAQEVSLQVESVDSLYKKSGYINLCSTASRFVCITLQDVMGNLQYCMHAQ